MKISIFILLFLVIHLTCLSQASVIFPQKISQTYVIRDTMLVTHSRFSFIDDSRVIREFRLNQHDYELYYSFKLNDRNYSVQRDSIKKLYQPKEFELVPDYFTGYTKLYDPHNLFSITIKNDYLFSFPSVDYRISRRDIKTYPVRVKELIPNAHKHFRYSGLIIATYYKKGEEIERKEYFDFIDRKELDRILELDIDQINLKLCNGFNDCLEMNLYCCKY